MSTITSSVPLLARNDAGDSRVATGRVAMGDTARELNLKSLDLGGMDFACCVSTGSWCCPSVDGFAVNSNGHSELSFDALYINPLEAMSAQRVNNQDLLITHEDVWAMHDQVEEGSKSASNHQGNSASKKTARDEGLHHHNGNSDVHHPGVNQTGFASKLLTTTHSSILTQGVQNV